MSIDLSGNTNFVCLKNLRGDFVVPRTNLAAVDMTVGNGLAISGNTMYTMLATDQDVSLGTTGRLLDAAVMKEVLSAYLRWEEVEIEVIEA